MWIQALAMAAGAVAVAGFGHVPVATSWPLDGIKIICGAVRSNRADVA